jgi:hypothetical protein
MSAKTIRRPSGDQSGWNSLPGLLVSRRWPVPSARISQMSSLPARSLWKTIQR